jgi:hypothetical protein
MPIQILNPDSLGKPLGQYSQLTRVKASEFLFIAGQVGADKDGKAPTDISCTPRTSPSSWPIARANFPNCSRAALIRGRELDQIGEARALRGERRADIGEDQTALRVEVRIRS